MKRYFYTVLFEHAGAWREKTTVQARSPRDAVRTTADGPGLYMAIPSRYFKPFAVKIRTKQEVEIS